MAQTSKRGFASMDPSKQREIASKGGKAAHLKGTAHEFTPEEAREAGRKGGTSVSRDRQHMAQIGREGGQARGERANLRAARIEPQSQEMPKGLPQGLHETDLEDQPERFDAGMHKEASNS
jgi:general stress protein YciG